MRGSAGNSTLRHVTDDLRGASDRAVLKVTQMIDTLPDRGAADQVLGPVRSRLGALKPPRPRRIRRILFSPLDAVIVPTSQWTASSCAIPRGVLKPMADFIEARLADRSASGVCGAACTLPNERLWSEAASILGAGGFPESWKDPSFQLETGIRPQVLPSLVEVVRKVLSYATELLEFADQGGAEIELVRPLILEAARSGPLGWRIVLALLVARSTRPARLAEQIFGLTKETRIARQLNESVQLVLGLAIDRLEAETATRPGVCMATMDAIEARTRLVERLVSFGEMRGELDALSKRAARDRSRLGAQFSEEIATTLRELPRVCLPDGAPSLDAQDEAAIRIEAMFEAVRRLDAAVRPLGDVERREQILEQAAQALIGPDMPDWLTRADRMRLCEILVGAEAAMRIVGA